MAKKEKEVGTGPKTILVGVLHRDVISPNFFKSFLTFFVESAGKYSLQISTADASFPEVAYNGLAEQMLNGKADYLLLVDAKLRLPPDLIQRLEGHGKDIVAALHFDPKTLAPMFRVDEKGKEVIPKEFKKGELLKASSVGMGCTLLSRKAFEKLQETQKDKPFFVLEMKNRREYRPSFLYFCNLAKKAGLDLFVDTGCIVGSGRSMTVQAQPGPRPPPTISA